jgi:hypothetical protein
VHEGTPLRLPCLRVGDVVIWGLTYHMFSSLKDALLGGGNSSPTEGFDRSLR